MSLIVLTCVLCCCVLNSQFAGKLSFTSVYPVRHCVQLLFVMYLLNKSLHGFTEQKCFARVRFDSCRFKLHISICVYLYTMCVYLCIYAHIHV